ncbi:CPBP family glutamic-type intramembrane protease [Macrococcus equi]|uniref:CPBP family glutamic-type intramembrane protease n=1 Tax=Macrococcus equi TaxID=3395462 RepID=UPI0039BDA631
MMQYLKKPVAGFLLLFGIIHIILFIMHSEHQVFWHIYTGLMLLTSIGYIYYERNINSRRLVDSFITGIVVALAIVILHTLFSIVFNDLHYYNLMKKMIHLGVYVKWQLVITLVLSIPLQELFMRNMLQNYLNENFNRYIASLIVSLCATSLFMYVVSLPVLFSIFITQFILALSYYHTKRLITPITGQILAIIIFMLIHR